MMSARSSHPDLWATAYHESGHAVAAVRHKLIVKSVDVEYTVHRFGACDYDHETAPTETRAICLLAAGAAERRYTGSHRAHDAGDIAHLGFLFKGSLLDPEIPYANRHPGADVERQRVVEKWYAAAEAFVDKEWEWIDRVAKALVQRRQLSGDEVKSLCSHVVVRLDVKDTARLNTTETEADEAPGAAVARDEATLIAAPAPTATHITKYDGERWVAAHGKFINDARTLTDEDLAHLAYVDRNHAERARAKRAGFVEEEDAFIKKHGGKPVTWKFFHQWLDNNYLPILGTLRTRIREDAERIDALEKQIKTLEERPQLEYRGVFSDSTLYQMGSLVTRSGGLWLALRETAATPGTASECWRLIVKEGHAK